MKNNAAISGFSLLELSMVMVVIALLIAGVMAGQELINAAKGHKIIDEFNRIQKAINIFRIKYDAFPGDFNRAAANLGCTGCNGNGDGIMGYGDVEGSTDTYGDEGLKLWQHLSLEGIFSDTYPGGNINGGATVIAGNVTMLGSKGASDGALYYVDYIPGAFPITTSDDPTMGQFIYLGRVMIGQAGGPLYDQAPVRPSVTTTEAETLDLKMDDGLPLTGEVRGYNVNDACHNEGVNVYNVDETAIIYGSGGCGIGVKVRSFAQ